MVMDEKMQMDHEVVRTAGKDFKHLAVSVEGMKNYTTEGGLTAGHFGGTTNGNAAFQAVNGALQRFAASVGKAHQFCVDAGQKLIMSADSTENTDVDNAWGVTKAGEKK